MKSYITKRSGFIVAVLLLAGVATETGLTAQNPKGEPSKGARPGRDQSVGKAIFTTCLGCHGNVAEGRRYMHAPALAGQDPDYLLRQLISFRTGKRGKITDAHGYQMVGRAAAIPGPEGVKAVISYIAGLPKAAATPVAERVIPHKIKAIVPICATCHGTSGEGKRDMQAPALNGLERYYIVQQLKNFRNGTRGYHPDDVASATMAAAAQQIPDEEAIDVLSKYYGR